LKEFYRRKLPHWHPDGACIFLTWRLHGSLPFALRNKSGTDGQQFSAMDRELDSAKTGPTWLKDPRIADCVVEALCVPGLVWNWYELCAWVVMSNHVHVLLDPHRPVCDITRVVKKTSARQANAILHRTGLPFWQAESYDHWVRDRDEFNRIVRYIEKNPVRAGLVDRIEDWKWSSAGRSVTCPTMGGDGGGVMRGE
jgi:putative transposase